MKSIYQISKDLDFATGKHALFFSHKEKMDALHRAQIELFAFYYGNVSGYQNGRPIPRVAYQVTQAVSSALQPFIKTATLTNISNGVVTAPTDMVHPTALRTTTGREIKLVDDDKVAGRLNSQIVKPTDEYPIAEISATGWQLYPNLSAIKVKYLSLPVAPEYVVNIVNGEEVYDDAASTGILWKPAQHNELINRTLSILGLNVKDAAVMQVAERNKQTGQ